jgi:hypothetical protein
LGKSLAGAMKEKAEALLALHAYDLAIEHFQIAMEYDPTLEKECNKIIDEMAEVCYCSILCLCFFCF